MVVEKLIKTLSVVFTRIQSPVKKSSGWHTAFTLIGVLGIFVVVIGFVPLALAWVSGNVQSARVNMGQFVILASASLIFLVYLAALHDSFVKSKRLGTKFTFNVSNPSAYERAQKALITAMSAPDDILLPLLDYAPETVSVPYRRERIVSLAGLETSPVGFAYWRVIALIVVIVGVFGQMFLPSIMDIVLGRSQDADAYFAVNQLGSQIALWFSGGSLLAFFIYLFGFFGFKGRRIFVDATGLWWRHLGRWVQLPWSDIQSISAYIYDPVYTTTARYYIVGKQGFIQWELQRAILDIDGEEGDKDFLQNPQRELDATARLLAITMQQTGLPLRDLQPLADALGYGVALAEAKTSSHLTPEPEMLHEANLLIAAVPKPPPTKINWGTFPIIAVLIVVVCFGPYAFVRYSQDALFPRYLASLPAKLNAKTPLWHDPLTKAAHGWPLHVPDAQNGDRLSYDDGGYTIINGGIVDINSLYHGSAVLPQSYGAIAIQVTVHMNKTAQSVDATGAGIIIRQPYPASENEQCMLLITDTGRWRDTCGIYFAENFSTTFSPYIHQGLGANNTLLVVARGQFVAFYANEHLLGYDFAWDREPFGYIGLVNRSSDISATFTDFTVWAINPPPNPNYI